MATFSSTEHAGMTFPYPSANRNELIQNLEV